MFMTKSLLEGSIVKSLIKISTPIIFANMLQTVYQLTDTFWVGRLGVNSVAAVSLSFPILFLLISLAIGFAMAGSILIAQYNGQNNSDKVAFIAGQTLSIVVILSLIISIFGYFSSKYILSFFTTDAMVLSQATLYLQISFISLVFLFIFNIFQSSLRSIGEVKLPMYIISFTVLLNFFIDPLFMYGYKFIPAMGVGGVAFATLLTQFLSSIIGLYLLFSDRVKIPLKLKDFVLQWTCVKRVIKLGFPSSIDHSSRSLGMLILTFIVSSFGTLAIASYGIGVRIFSFVIIPAIGFAIANSALVGNNLGAKQFKRAKEIVWVSLKFSFITLSLFGIILFIFARNVSAFFVPSDFELIIMSATFVRYLTLSFGLFGIQSILISTFKSAGQTKMAMYLALTNTLFLILFSYLLSTTFNYGVLGIWISYPLSNVFSVLLAIYFYRKKEWMTSIV